MYIKILYISRNPNVVIMIKIESIDLRNFDNSEHFQYMSGFDKLITTHTDAIMGSEVIYGIFKNTLMAEDLALRLEQGSSVLQTLDRLDRQRDKTWSAIQIRIRATLLSPIEDEVQSAQVIQQILNLYGDVCSHTYSEQSSAIAQLTDDMLLPVIAVHVERIGLLEWVRELKRQNEKFTSVFNDWNSEFAGRESNDVKAARTLIDPVYLQLAERINASLALEFASEEVIEFASRLNEKIKYYKTPPAFRVNRSYVEIKEEV